MSIPVEEERPVSGWARFGCFWVYWSFFCGLVPWVWEVPAPWLPLAGLAAGGVGWAVWPLLIARQSGSRREPGVSRRPALVLMLVWWGATVCWSTQARDLSLPSEFLDSRAFEVLREWPKWVIPMAVVVPVLGVTALVAHSRDPAAALTCATACGALGVVLAAEVELAAEPWAFGDPILSIPVYLFMIGAPSVFLGALGAQVRLKLCGEAAGSGGITPIGEFTAQLRGRLSVFLGQGEAEESEQGDADEEE